MYYVKLSNLIRFSPKLKYECSVWPKLWSSGLTYKMNFTVNLVEIFTNTAKIGLIIKKRNRALNLTIYLKIFITYFFYLVKVMFVVMCFELKEGIN